METNVELKVSKWTEEEVSKAVGQYVPQDAASVERIAVELGRSKRSVIGKLVHAGVYVAPEKPKAKAKDEGPTKGEILQSLVDNGFNVEGFETATKPALTRLRDFVANQ